MALDDLPLSRGGLRSAPGNVHDVIAPSGTPFRVAQVGMALLFADGFAAAACLAQVAVEVAVLGVPLPVVVPERVLLSAPWIFGERSSGHPSESARFRDSTESVLDSPSDTVDTVSSSLAHPEAFGWDFPAAAASPVSATTASTSSLRSLAARAR